MHTSLSLVVWYSFIYIIHIQNIYISNKFCFFLSSSVQIQIGNPMRKLCCQQLRSAAAVYRRYSYFLQFIAAAAMQQCVHASK